jgi:hypothetical protein
LGYAPIPGAASTTKKTGFTQKVDPIWTEPVSTGNVGARARYERAARNSYSDRKFEPERAAHALPVLACLFLPRHFLGKAKKTVNGKAGTFPHITRHSRVPEFFSPPNKSLTSNGNGIRMALVDLRL